MIPITYIVAVILFIAAVFYCVICFIFGRLIAYAHRQPITKNPKDYGMKYEDVSFESIDGLNLKGWLIHGKEKAVAIITHPFPFNRQGFSPEQQGPLTRFKTNVDLLKTAKVLNDVGYSVLMFDFRNHGQSDKGISGIGITECQDVAGAIDFVKSSEKLKNVSVVLVSFCMGANATITAAAKYPEKFKRIDCIVAIQPISMKVFLRTYIRKTFTPLGLALLPGIGFFYKLLSKHSLNEASPLKYVDKLETPILYVQAETDPWTELGDILAMHENTKPPKELLMLKEKISRFDTYNYFGDHPKELLEFLRKHARDASRTERH